MLLLHGFTGSPPELRTVALHLHSLGYTVRVPLLPGHGTSVAHLNYVSCDHWLTHAEEELQELARSCTRLFVGGLSMGSLVALHLAATVPKVRGLVLYAPALRLRDPKVHLVSLALPFRDAMPKPQRDDFVEASAARGVWSYESYPLHGLRELLRLQGRVGPLVPRIQCPTLVFRAIRDRTIHPKGVEWLYTHLASTNKDMVTLMDSGHCLTADAERDFVAVKTGRFIQRVMEGG